MRYRCTVHALNRLHERFPELAVAFPDRPGSMRSDALRRLSCMAMEGRPFGTQRRADLVVRRRVPGPRGPIDLFFTLTPRPEEGCWIITTVLDEAMAQASVEQARQDTSRAGAAHRRDRRSSDRLRRLRGVGRRGRARLRMGVDCVDMDAA